MYKISFRTTCFFHVLVYNLSFISLIVVYVIASNLYSNIVIYIVTILVEYLGLL